MMLRIVVTRVRLRLSSSAFVAMVETANLGNGNDCPSFGWLRRPRLRRVLLQSQVRASSMIVAHERLKVLMQAPFIEHDHMIKALAANGSDHALDVGALPR